MKKFLFVDSTWPVNTRTERFFNSFTKKYDCKICAWNRNPNMEEYPNHTSVLETKVGYGKPFKKILYLPYFLYHIIKALKDVRPNVIFASHWDSLLLTVIAKAIVKSNAKVVYDCLDLPTSRNKFTLKFLQALESKLLKRVDLTILASRFFVSLYKEHDHIVFENYPSKAINRCSLVSPEWYNEALKKGRNSSILSWIGVVRYPEILQNLLRFIKRSNKYTLLVFGDGPSLSYMINLVDEMGLRNKVTFFGRYNSCELKFIYSVSDLVWAAYPAEDFNARYAISNKYFECSLFSKVPIISDATMMSKDIAQGCSVISVNESCLDDISNKIEGFNLNSKFVKYEPDTYWECHELKLFNIIDQMFLKKESEHG